MAEKSRNTKQKTSIIEFLQKNKGNHQTADEIWNGLFQEHRSVGRATVYRVLATLAQEGLVREYTLKGDSPSCFEYLDEQLNCSKHFHVVCDECRQVIHFDSSSLAKMLYMVQSENDFTIDETRTVFYGKCATCR